MPSLSMPSPIGHLTIDEQDDAIVAIRWADEPAGNGSPLLAEAARQLAAYFAGQLTDFDLPLAPAGSPFEKRVWAAMQQIPYGETRCYGAISLTRSIRRRARSAAPVATTRSRSSSRAIASWRKAGSA